MERSNIHSRIRLLIFQTKELVAEAEVEKARKLTTAGKRAKTAEVKAKLTEMALRKKAGESHLTPLFFPVKGWNHLKI